VWVIPDADTTQYTFHSLAVADFCTKPCSTYTP
jgi:hypothetical protein